MNTTTAMNEGWKLLDATQIADRLNVPVSWVREHTRNGYIPHVPLGRYVRYREDEVLAWLDNLSAGAGPWRKHRPYVAA